MSFSRLATFDVLRVLANGSISTTYAKLGSAMTHAVRSFCITNQTDGDMFIAITNGSTPASDGTADNLFVPATNFRLYDVSSNAGQQTNSPPFALAKGDQLWVRQSSAPTTNSVYLEILYAVGE